MQLSSQRSRSRTRRKAAICTARLLSSTVTPGQAAAMISSRETRAPCRSASAASMSSAREPIVTGHQAPFSSCFSRRPPLRSRRKRLNSSVSAGASVSIAGFRAQVGRESVPRAPRARHRVAAAPRPRLCEISSDSAAASAVGDPEGATCPLRPFGGRGRGPIAALAASPRARPAGMGRVRWVAVGGSASPTSPRPSPPPRAEREYFPGFRVCEQERFRTF